MRINCWADDIITAEVLKEIYLYFLVWQKTTLYQRDQNGAQEAYLNARHKMMFYISRNGELLK